MDKAIASIRFLASLARAAARATFTIITRDRRDPKPRPKGCTENPNTCPHDYATCYPDKPCPWGPK